MSAAPDKMASPEVVSETVLDRPPANTSKSGDKDGILPLVRFLVQNIPVLARVALLHTFHISEQSQYLDLRTALIITLARAFMTPSKPRSITSVQRLLNKDPGIKGRIWVSKVTALAPTETSVRDVVIEAIENLAREQHAAQIKSDKVEIKVPVPEIAPLEAEWTGYRPGVAKDDLLPDISEEAKYAEMMRICKSNVTVLYFHGGAYISLDPATHRPTTKKLAKLTEGRVYSVRYRLAPQHPFPAALIDALSAYLTLLYPPPGSFHEPVRPDDIVFAGDSAGGNLSLALLQLLLELRRHSTAILWHGSSRIVPLPAGCAVNSPWCDISSSLPSCRTNALYDYLPVLSSSAAAEQNRRRPACSAWPSSPPRTHMYADDSLVAHPLVTLLAAESWEGAPPVYICTGWELLADEDKCLARALHSSGVKVVFEDFEALPHCFALLLGHLPAARRCFDGWAGFMRRVVEDQESVKTRFVTVKAKTLKEVEIKPENVTPLTEEAVKAAVRGWADAKGKVEAKL